MWKNFILTRFLRRGRHFIGRYWGSKEYYVYHRSLEDVSADVESHDDRYRFFAAQESDIPWMYKQLGEWARWCYGGKQVLSTEEVLREQFLGGDITIVGVEKIQDGAIVFIGSLCHDEYLLTLLGNAFDPETEVSSRRAWVPPEHRGKGVATAGKHFISLEAARSGLKGIWSLVNVDNLPSNLMNTRCGYVRRGQARWLIRGRRRFAAIRLAPDRNWRTYPVPPEIPHI